MKLPDIGSLTLWVVLCVPAVAPAQRPAAMLTEDDTLKGRTSMSVSVTSAIKDVPEAGLKSDIQKRLRDSGITVLGTGYPRLRLRLDALFHWDSGATVWTMTVEFVQALPLPGENGASAAAVTWQATKYGIMDALQSTTLRSMGWALVDEFLAAHAAVNPNSATAVKSEVNKSVISEFETYSPLAACGEGETTRPRDPRCQKSLKDAESLMRIGHQILWCSYKTPDGYFQAWEFWYKTVPPEVPAMLASSPPRMHQLRRLGVKALDVCPPTIAAARAASTNVMRPEDR